MNESTVNRRGGGEWIDTAKVITMFLVLIGHSNYYSIQTEFGGITAFDQTISRAMTTKLMGAMTSFIYSFHMPFFMCLSGMCLKISLRPNTGLGAFIKKKAKRLLYPFLFVTLFLSVPCKYLSGYYDDSDSPLWDIIVGQFLLFGNSHLWFVVSLFIISVTYLFLYRKNLNKGWKFYSILILASAVGMYIQSTHTEFLGIPGAIKNMLFFSLGFEFVQKTYILNLKWSRLIISWVLMFATFIATRNFFPMKIVLAIWGCINMIVLSQLSTHKISKQRWYDSVKRNSYFLYLYSDPFNYLFIALIVMCFGDRVLGEDTISMIAFGIRFIGSIVMAYTVIYIINHIVTPLYSWYRAS